MLAITTFSDEGYKKYGRKSLESFVKYWPINLIAYYEGEKPDFEHEKIEYRPFYEIPHVLNFLAFINNNPLAQGETDLGYNYLYDVNKFSRKMFAQIDAMTKDEDLIAGKFFWLDNDVITKQEIPVEFLEDLLKGTHLAFLDRPGLYTETGFVGFNTEHPQFQNFFYRYINSLKRGIIFTLPYWTDCHAFDYAREGKGKPIYSKTGGDIHVWKKSPLQKYMTHHKGQRKKDI